MSSSGSVRTWLSISQCHLFLSTAPSCFKWLKSTPPSPPSNYSEMRLASLVGKALHIITVLFASVLYGRQPRVTDFSVQFSALWSLLSSPTPVVRLHVPDFLHFPRRPGHPRDLGGWRRTSVPLSQDWRPEESCLLIPGPCHAEARGPTSYPILQSSQVEEKERGSEWPIVPLGGGDLTRGGLFLPEETEPPGEGLAFFLSMCLVLPRLLAKGCLHLSSSRARPALLREG